MIIEMPITLKSTVEGYKALIEMHHLLSDSNPDIVFFDFGKSKNLDLNLIAVIGALVNPLREAGIYIDIIHIQPYMEVLLFENMFLKDFGRAHPTSAISSTISYRIFSRFQDIEFREYIRKEVFTKPEFPVLSKLLEKKIIESIFEVFENAVTHGDCKNIFTCGQYFPNRQLNLLSFSIVDMGVTIKTNVNNYLRTSLSGSDSIIWAMKYGNTTKTGPTSGGLGLDIILEFIKLNKGVIQIVSSDGYWEYKNGETIIYDFQKPFPGTIVNIQVNLDDTDYYSLIEEVSLDSIF
jgi:hypothetical protein